MTDRAMPEADLDARFAALLVRLNTLRPRWWSRAIKEARLRNWENQAGNERGRAGLLSKWEAEIKTLEREANDG